MTTETDRFISVIKTETWERAKGALRAVGALEGQRRNGDFENVEARVEEFITKFEDDGLHE